MNYLQILKYICSGLLSVSAYYLTIYFLFEICGWNYRPVIGLSLLVGAFLNFYLNKYYTFEIKGRLAEGILKYFIIFLLNYFLQILIIITLFDQFKLNLYFASIIALMVTSILGFIFFKKFVFSKKESE